MPDHDDCFTGGRGMAGWGQLGVASLGFLGAGRGAARGLLGMSKGLTGGAFRCLLGVAILVFLQVEASDANQVLCVNVMNRIFQPFHYF